VATATKDFRCFFFAAVLARAASKPSPVLKVNTPDRYAEQANTIGTTVDPAVVEWCKV
jgi:hypothetical protein